MDHYDPKGYIQTYIKSQNLGEYAHHNIEDEEKFKNMEWLEIWKKMQDQLREVELKRQRELEMSRN